MDVDVDSAVRALHMHASGPDSDKEEWKTNKLAGLAGRARCARGEPLGWAAAQRVQRAPGKRMCGGVRCQRDRAAQLGDGAMCGARTGTSGCVRDDHELIRGG